MKDKQTIFKAITLYEPWASWVIMGYKTIETRTHDRLKNLKGQTIIIHAGQKIDKSDAAFNNPYLKKFEIEATYDIYMKPGHVLGTAFVADVGMLTHDHSKEAMIDCEEVLRFGLRLTDIDMFNEPVPVKGGLGIWYYDVIKKQKVKKP